MVKREVDGALPGLLVGFVSEAVVAARPDLAETVGWQVRAPRGEKFTPDQPVECWLVSGMEVATKRAAPSTS